MKITDLNITLFDWDDIPVASYNAYNKFGGNVKLGLLTLETDEGISGYSFLGSSAYCASIDAPGLIDKLKPLILGENPLNKEYLYEVLNFVL